MRAPRALLVVLITALLGVFAVALAPPSSAGGPTSVLLVDPDNGRATALYASDPRYQRLSDLLGAMSSPVSDGSAPTLAGGNWTPGSGGITVTWLMHDVAVWRIDHVFLGSGTVSIASVSDMSGIAGLNEALAWHRASDPKGLTSLLTGLGLGPTAAPTPTPASAAPAPAPAPAAARPVAQRAQPAAEKPASATVPAPLWGLAGLLLGAGLALVADRLRRRGRRAPDTDDEAPELPASAEVLHG